MLKFINAVKSFTKFYLLFLTFLLPIKFGTLAIMPETTGYFSENYLDYLFVNFPNNSFGIFSGIGLLLAVSCFGIKIKNSLNLILFIALAFISLLGIFNASTLDYVYLSLGHIFGVVSYIISIYLLVNYDKKTLDRFYDLIAISAIITLLVGVYQYFIGFDEMIEFYKSQEKGALEVDLTNKLMERRIYSTFGGCNVYAGYLLLILGIAIIRINKFSEFFSPQKLSQKVLLGGVFAVLYIFVIFNTGSRAVIAGVGGAFTVMIFLSKISKKYKITFAVLLFFMMGSGIWLTQFIGRNFASFTERLGYAKSSLIMMYNHIFLGSGWGDFMVDNQKYRFIISNEAARDPHNIFLSFGSSAGIFAFLIIVGCFLVPIVALTIKYYRSRNIKDGVILFSLIAFTIHTMLDVDYQIPAIFALIGAILITLNLDEEKVITEKIPLKIFLLIIGFSAFGLAYYNTLAEKKYDDFLMSIQNRASIYEVEKKYKEVEKIKPYSPFHKINMYKYLLYIYRNPLMAKKALPYLEKAIEKSPERSGYYKYLSEYYSNIEKDMEKSQKYLKKSIELAPYTEFLEK